MMGFQISENKQDNQDKDSVGKEKKKTSPRTEIPSPEPSIIQTPKPDRIENRPEADIPNQPTEISSPGMSPEISSAEITEM